MEKKMNQKQASSSDLMKVLSELPKEKREIIRSAIFAAKVEERHFSGPLPPPEDFAKYEERLPGSADRILKMAEKQMEHRIETERKIIGYKIKAGKTGQILGFVLVLVCLISSLILGLNGHDTLAKWIGVTTVFCVAVVFVLNKIPYIGKNEEK